MLNNEEPPLKLYLCLPSCSSYCYTSVSFVVHILIGPHLYTLLHILFDKIEEGALDDIIFMVIFFDDLIIGGDTTEHIEDVKNMLEEKFKLKDLRELHYFLRIEIIHLADVIWISQYHYIVS